MIAALLGFAAAFTLLFLRVPIATALALVGFGGLVLLNGWVPAMATLGMAAQSSTMAYSLSVLPLFVLMGNLVAGAGISGNLFRAAQMFIGRRRGGVAMATILACGGFGAICGSSVATAATMGRVAIPAMRSLGYHDRLSTATVAAGGTLGILIPPSIMLIVYGAMAGLSVVKLYAAAFIPGFFLAGMYILYVVVLAMVKPERAPALPRSESDVPFSQVALMLLKSFFPLALLILSVLGAIMFGIATPTEAAAVGAAGAAVLAAAYRSLTWQGLRESVFLTARTSAMVCWLFVGSAIFSAAFALLGGQELVEQWVLGMNLSKTQFLVLTQVIIFVLGWPLEWTEIIVIFMPIFIPLLDNFGVDPLFFGLLVALNLQTAFLSPPVAMAAFYLKGVAPPHVTLNQIFGGMLPFMGIQILAIVLLYQFPGIGLWLPQVLYK